MCLRVTKSCVFSKHNFFSSSKIIETFNRSIIIDSVRKIYKKKKIMEHNDVITNEQNNSVIPRLGNCEVCAANAARYTCPQCEVKTCCLRCVNIHKKELQCNGIRNPTKYIPLRDITERDFMNDYYFLEDCNRYVQFRKNDIRKRYTRYNRDLPKHLNRLKHAAKERNTHLKIVLQHFVKHRENTTFYNWNERKIWWRIKWIFMNANNLTYNDEKCNEDLLLKDLLDKYVNVKSCEHVPEKKRLHYYYDRGLENIKVLLKAEGIKFCAKRFYLMDIDKSLKENLSNKTLVEYPTIYVTYEDPLYDYDIIKNDDDIREETKIYCDQLNKTHKILLEQYRKQQELKNLEEANMILDDDNDIDSNCTDKTFKENQKRKQRVERKRKRQEYEKHCTNFLFTDEHLMEILSTSEEEEEIIKT